MIGETLAHYRLTEKLGAGGMGEVYRATDAKLHREVAIKVLPSVFASDRERMARFDREAHLLASLSHPNIAAVYGLEETPSGTALVMELVEGDDLSTRLRQGALPLVEALRIAHAIAEALEWAHEHGVIHRDLKPGNIKVTHDGRVKVLDFGLAKALDSAPAASSSDAEHSPTISLAATRAGIILGTAAYMSPEQASGKPVDKRADVWSFGVVLFEMLSGHRLFDGETVSHTLADVLRAGIDWQQLPASTPPAVRQLLERCLDRDIRHRLRDIGEARIAIEAQLVALQSSSLSGASGLQAAPTLPVRPASPVAWGRVLPWMVAAAGLAAAEAAWTVRPATPAAPSLNLDVKLTSDRLWTQIGPSVALSPDGSRLAYITGGETTRQLYVRRLDQLDGTKLTEGPGNDTSPYHPFFSPDGAWIGYVTTSELRKVPVTGGTSITLAKITRGRGASWGPDDTIVFTRSPSDGLSIIPATGGDPRTLTTLDKEKKEATHRWPQFLPGGKTVIFTAGTQAVGDFDNATVEAVTVATGARKVLHRGGYYGRYLPSGHLVFVNKGTIFAAPFDVSKLEVTGTPVPVVQNVTSTPAEGAAQFASSETGVLAYVRGGPLVPQYPVIWVDREGRTSRLLDDPGAYANPRLSPDGTRLALTVLREGNWDVWVYDLLRGVSTRLTFDETPDTEEIWSPDGRELIYSSDKNGPANLVRKPADGSGEGTVVTKSDVPLWASSWSSNGRLVAMTSSRPNLDVGILDLTDSKITWPLATQFAESDAAYSPDTRWLAYSSAESGQPEIYVRPADGGGGRWQISDSGGGFPRWSHDGRELFFRTNTGIMSASIEVVGSSLRTGKPRQLFTGAFRGGTGGVSIAGSTFGDYDVTGDGKRFVMFPLLSGSGEERAGQITLVTSWFDQLKASASAK
jgi:serine/threonine protein kinase/Tol biopolymer transport system component